MDFAIGVAVLWIVFAGAHIGLATRRIRAALVGRLGEWGFVLGFSLVAAVLFGLLVHFYALHRLEGTAGPALGATGPLRVVLVGVVGAGLVLAFASLGSYPGSAYAMGSPQARSPRGLERVTRHPFFVGTALAAGAHTLLATRLVGTVFSLGLAVVALAGAWHQDRKLLARRGEPFAAYLAATSVVPFAAVLSGRQRLVLRELPWGALLATLLLVVWLRAVHESIFARGGAWAIAVVIGGAAILMAQDWRAARRRARGADVVPVGAHRGTT